MTIGTCNGTAGVFSGVAYRPDPPCGAVSYRYYADQATAVQPTDAMSAPASTAGAAAAGAAEAADAAAPCMACVMPGTTMPFNRSIAWPTPS